MKAIFLDAKTKTAEFREFGDDEAIRAAIGGFMEIAHTFANGDLLLVDEEARFHEMDQGFRLDGPRFPILIGHGVVVGADFGDVAGAATPITPLVTWLRRSDDGKGWTPGS